MLFKSLNGRVRDISYIPYLVEWDRVVSAPQKRVKDFLKPYWERDVVLEEAAIIGKRMRFDLVNLNKQIVVEVSPKQHTKYSEFFHGSVAGFKAALKRDLQKEEWCQINGFAFCELLEEDLAEDLTPALFKDRFNIDL